MLCVYSFGFRVALRAARGTGKDAGRRRTMKGFYRKPLPTAITMAVLALLASTGCQRDDYARRLIEPTANLGQMMDLTASNEQLVQSGKIDAARQFQMPDGVEIDTWIVKAAAAEGPAAETRGTVVILHDLGDSKAPHLSLARRLANRGFDVVLPDLRAHGRSTGRYVTYGAKEKHDVRAIVGELLRDGEIHEPVYAYGLSLGAATAIQYAAIEPRCKGVVAMAPYQDAQTICRRWMAFHAPTMSEADFMSTLERAGQIAGFNPEDASSIRAVQTTTTPLLLVHGLLDSTVPWDQSQAVFDAASEPKQIIIVPWASHITLPAFREQWVAEQIDHIATTGLKTDAPAPDKPENSDD